ncbi:MAG: VWA domain-containing protein, partial [Chloroflexi bacterium]|nr:VWA domain-containing protein [Chloroflexota bacterium]
MSWLSPGMLAFGLLAIPILLLYMLKLRRRETPVSSTLLWQQLLRDRQANTPWQRLKRNLLLFLQLLILAGLVLALARPVLPVPSLSSGATIVLLDGSASMAARDVSPDRFTVAREAVARLIDGLPAGAPVTLILAAAQPHLLAAAESDHEALHQALSGAQPGSGGADWPAAFALAAGANRGSQVAATLIVSDGGLPEEGLPALPGEVTYLPVGQSSENLAITAMAARPETGEVQLFAAVQNYGSQSRTVIVSLLAGDQLVEARQVEIPAGERQDVLYSGLPAAAQRYTVRLSNPPGQTGDLDALALDDSAATVYQPGLSGRLVLVSPGNLFLRRLLESLPGVQPFFVLAGPDAPVAIPGGQYDLYVLDGVVPEDLPPGNVLFVNPPSNDFFPVGDLFQDTQVEQVADSPLTRYVAWDNVHVAQARQVEPPEWAETLVQAHGGPLVFTGETDGRRLAVVTFDLHDSDLPLQIGYPILFSNLIQYLSRPADLSILAAGAGDAPGGAAASLAAGTNLQLQAGGSVLIHPAAGAARALVTLPDGSTQIIDLPQGQGVFDDTHQLGLYSVSYPGSPDVPADGFAVNLFAP